MTTAPQPGPTRTPDRAWLWLTLLWAVLFATRIAAPANLLDQDQERPAAYVLDAVNNGHWLCQRDLLGDITSKPPVWTWLAAVPTVLFGRINLFTLYLPGALGGLGAMLLLFAAGKKYLSRRAAIFAALAVILSASGFKWLGLARTDGIFAFTVTATALLAWRAWNRGGGWTWFWLMAAIATLTKGPLGLVLGAAGLLAVPWERKSGEPLPLKGSHLIGLIVFLAVAGGWFAAAYWVEGRPLIDKMLGRELTSHMVSDHKGHLPGTLLWQPPLYYLKDAAPWSLLAYFGLWRIWQRPSAHPPQRRFERFLFCWFAIGLFIFSLAPHQRADLLWPIMPAGALIAGNELARLTARSEWPQLRFAAIAVTACAVAAAAVFYFKIRENHPLVQKTAALKNLAGQLETTGGREFPITHVDSPMTFQFYLSTLRPRVSASQAAALLNGPEAAYVAISDTAQLDAFRRDDSHWSTVLQAEPGDASFLRIISNRPDLAPGTNGVAFDFGGLSIRYHNSHLIRATAREFLFAADSKEADVRITNESDEPQLARVAWSSTGRRSQQTHTLAPGEIWSVWAPMGK